MSHVFATNISKTCHLHICTNLACFLDCALKKTSTPTSLTLSYKTTMHRLMTSTTTGNQGDLCGLQMLEGVLLFVFTWIYLGKFLKLFRGKTVNSNYEHITSNENNIYTAIWDVSKSGSLKVSWNPCATQDCHTPDASNIQKTYVHASFFLALSLFQSVR